MLHPRIDQSFGKHACFEKAENDNKHCLFMAQEAFHIYTLWFGLWGSCGKKLTGYLQTSA